MSVFLPFGNSWLASSHRIKDHPWNSMTSCEIKSSLFLAKLQSLLLQVKRPQSHQMISTSSTSTTTIQSSQRPRYFKLLLLHKKLLVPFPSSPETLELVHEVEQERCLEPWPNLSLRGSSSATTRCIIWLLEQSPSMTTIVPTMNICLYKIACVIPLPFSPRC